MKRTAPHILLVEDDEYMGLYCQELLGRLSYKTSWVTNGPDALDAFRSYKPDVVLSDFNLDGPMTGILLLRRITEEAQYDIRRVLMTGSELWELGPKTDQWKPYYDDFLKKPFETDRLLTALGAYPKEISSDLRGATRLLKTS